MSKNLKKCLTTPILLILLTLPACRGDQSLGEFFTESGQQLEQGASEVQTGLENDPGLDALIGDETRKGLGVVHLVAGALILLGGVLTKRTRDQSKVIQEIDANPATPPASEQAASLQSKKIARKINGR